MFGLLIQFYKIMQIILVQVILGDFILSMHLSITTSTKIYTTYCYTYQNKKWSGKARKSSLSPKQVHVHTFLLMLCSLSSSQERPWRLHQRNGKKPCFSIRTATDLCLLAIARRNQIVISPCEQNAEAIEAAQCIIPCASCWEGAACNTMFPSALLNVIIIVLWK